MCKIGKLSHRHAHIQHKQVDQALPSHNPVLSNEWFTQSSQKSVPGGLCHVIQEQLQGFLVESEDLVAQDYRYDAEMRFVMAERLGGQKTDEQHHRGR